MKNFFEGWGSNICIAVVILGLGILPIIQGISYSAKELRLQEEIIDLYQFNGHLSTENAIQQLQLDQANEVLEQQHNMLKDMYDKLRQWEKLPPWPEDNKKDRPSRSEA